MPALSDDLNRANEIPLSGGGNWTTGFGDGSWNLTGNVAVPAALGSDSSAFYSGANWAADQSVSAKITVNSTGAGTGPGVCLRRVSGVRTYYRVTVSHSATNNINFARYVAGTFTSLASFTVTWVDGDLLNVTVVGPRTASVLTAFQNAVQIGTFTDNSTITSGAPGIAYSSTATSASVDDWSASSDDIAMTLPFQAIPFMGGVL